MKDSIDLCVSFDTTGSMYSCLAQVRNHVEKLVKGMFSSIDNVRIAILAHGDYCDGEKVLTALDFSDNKDAICKFIRSVESTSGGDSDECYEFVLNRARSLSWTSGKNKALVMIGDAEPHKVGYTCGKIKNDLDWKNEAKLLVESGVNIIPIQALSRSGSNYFYDGLAKISKCDKLELQQFQDVNDILMAIAMSRAGKIEEFEKTINKRGGISYQVLKVIDSLSGRKVRVDKKSKLSKFAVHPSRFQVLDVEEDCRIDEFVESNDLVFKKGRGFYEFTKTVTVQDYKEVIAQDKETDEMFSGDKAREVLGIPIGVTADVKPSALRDYRGFIQSTSMNRKLLAGTKFLYEMDES